MKNSVLLLFMAMGWLIESSLSAQSLTPQVIASQGGHFQNTTFSVSYTVGEMVAVSTISANNFIFTQGFHQPDKFAIVNQVADIESNWNIQAFPNPVTEQLNLSLTSDKIFNLTIRIIDAAGRLVSVQSGIKTTPGEQVIQLDFSQFASGVYHIRLDDQKSGVSQILKALKSNF